MLSICKHLRAFIIQGHSRKDHYLNWKWLVLLMLGEKRSFVPSRRASQTSFIVTLSALNRIAMFWDFFGSSTRFSWFSIVGRELSFGVKLEEFTMNNVSIISSFNLQSQQHCPNLKYYKLTQKSQQLTNNSAWAVTSIHASKRERDETITQQKISNKRDSRNSWWNREANNTR